jgi:hypothetical protein
MSYVPSVYDFAGYKNCPTIKPRLGQARQGAQRVNDGMARSAEMRTISPQLGETATGWLGKLVGGEGLEPPAISV